VELLTVALVWLFFGALNVATSILEPHRGPPPFDVPTGVNPRVLINPVVWAALTVLILWLSRRVSLDRTFWRRRWLPVVLGAVLAANVSDLVSDAAWDAFAPASVVQRAQGGGGRRFRPGPRNLTWLDDLAVILAVMGVATIRGWLLRERARRADAHRREAALQAESASARASAAQLHAQLAEARLDALRRQLDPHFLFNTLNAVSALVERDPRGVRRMIGQLSDLLRHSMDVASAPEIPLRQELDLLGRYVDIMRVRFEDELEIEVRADPRALDSLVPNMILQPLVENAIKHGVERSDDGGRVDVEALLEGDTLVLRVRDDGPGMATWSAWDGDAPPGANGARAGGVGLRNTAARLEQLYGVSQRFSVGPHPQGGTLVEVRLPYHTNVGALGGSVSRSADEAPRAG
jgi:signal transduction histidine kinase